MPPTISRPSTPQGNAPCTPRHPTRCSTRRHLPHSPQQSPRHATSHHPNRPTRTQQSRAALRPTRTRPHFCSFILDVRRAAARDRASFRMHVWVQRRRRGAGAMLLGAALWAGRRVGRVDVGLVETVEVGVGVEEVGVVAADVVEEVD
ncbi:hypothetical protein BCR44DRAFT_203123, partial [Catenaria anguillulae PL171]